MPKSRNAYSLFLADFRKEYKGDPKAINVDAYPRWESLSVQERDRYERMARDLKNRRKQTNAGRCDNQGNLLSTRIDPKEHNMRRNAEERNGISLLVKDQGDVLNLGIYLVHFTTYCVTQQGQYLLAEVGALEYCLKLGVKRTFHAFLKPGDIPIGYRYEAQNQAESKLQIPLENFDEATGDYKKVWEDLKAFISPGRQKNLMPPLFCLGADRDKLAECLQALGYLVGNEDASDLYSHVDASVLYSRIWSLEAMVGELYLCVMSQARSEMQILTNLKSSSWDDKQDARCEFHRDKDAALCAMAIVKKYCYAMSDMLSVVFNFELTTSHLPQESDRPCAMVIDPGDSFGAVSRFPASARSTPSRPLQPPFSQSWEVDQRSQSRVSQEEVFYSDEEDEVEDEEEGECRQPAVRLPKAPARSQAIAAGVKGSQTGQDWPSLHGSQAIAAGVKGSQTQTGQDWPSLHGVQVPPSTRLPMSSTAWHQPAQEGVPDPRVSAPARPAPTASGSLLQREGGVSLPFGRGTHLRTETPSAVPPPLGIQSQVGVPMAGLGRGLVLEGDWPTLPSAPRSLAAPRVPSHTPSSLHPAAPSSRTPPAIGVPMQPGVGRGYVNAGQPKRMGRGAMPPELKARSAATLPSDMKNLSLHQ